MDEQGLIQKPVLRIRFPEAEPSCAYEKHQPIGREIYALSEQYIDVVAYLDFLFDVRFKDCTLLLDAVARTKDEYNQGLSDEASKQFELAK